MFENKTLKTFQPPTSKQNTTNNSNNKNSLSTQTTLLLMTTKSMVESTWAEDMGHFLYHLNPDTRKIRFEKLK